MIISSMELVKLEMKLERLIFRQFFYAGDFILIHGAPGVGKSRFAMSMAVEMAMNGERVVYADSETPKSLLIKRVSEIGSHPNLYYVLDETVTIDYIVAIEGVVIIDNFSSNFLGVEQKDQVEVSKVLRPLADSVRQKDGRQTVILLHHDNRAGTMFGSSEFLRSASLVIHLLRSRLIIDKSRHEYPKVRSTFEYGIYPNGLTLTEVCPLSTDDDDDKDDSEEGHIPYEDYPDVPRSTVRSWVKRGKIGKKK
ncbi:MAG: hypothetical protein BWK79_00710 [Beggiatoa sp. IS2]|nr:MAG: hypothetical protein BWK79_00710 [Beggiatoa sp. IS2]